VETGVATGALVATVDGARHGGARFRPDGRISAVSLECSGSGGVLWW
jgi:hypothetical protein